MASHKKMDLLGISAFCESLGMMVKAGIPITEAIGLMTKGSESKGALKDALIDMDCRNEPEKFYEQLQLVRTKRADVEKSIKRMDEILTKHRESILDFRKGLKKWAKREILDTAVAIWLS